MAQKNGRALIYLESDEEIPGIIQRIEQEKEAAITLVVPKASVVLQSVINLKLLQRVSGKAKKDIALVSQDAIGRNLAAQVGIPVFDSINAKIPVLEPVAQSIEKDEIIEVNMDKKSKPPVKVHHFQEEEAPHGDDVSELTESPVDTDESENDDEDDDVENNDTDDTDETNDTISDEPDDTILPDKGEQSQRPLRHATVVSPQTVQRDAVSTLQNAVQSPPDRSPQKRTRRGFWFGIIAMSCVIIAGLIIFYPKAYVKIVVPGEAFNQTIDIAGKKDQKEADLTKSIIPMQVFEVEKESKKTVSATGKKNVGQKAKGSVSLTNVWSLDAKKLTAGTRLTKDSKVFVTTVEVTIPGATVGLQQGQIVTSPGKATITIEALEAGDSYNIAPGRFALSELPADQQEKIYGETSAALTGGSTQEITIVSADDVERAKESLRTEIADGAKKELTDQAKGLMLLDKAIQVETISATPSVGVDTKADSFDLTVKAKASGATFSETALRDVFLAQVKEKVPQDKELVLNETSQDEIVATVKELDTKVGTMTISGSIKTKIGPKIDIEPLRAKIAGKKQSEAITLLKSVSGIQDATIEIKPRWMFGWTPLSARQIIITITYT
ncbi:hypothetical protein GW889_00010 [Candidatus Berkelbacteria bacterium]|uniref:Baseplate protein J-like domain-containing protein n=1 Tax=Candidatus Berkelbacteria bacterium CG10_big_fil_rev_8_21_14_0_10_43_14 TaxID=1974515 RepID=A0A2M6R932_9BACT|nr:hypothetical protein [Candidatus Berkelbacteria bacterium]OIP05987.1 MAG: hypothetical protein AUK41_03620 [Candidatus Berkelbacteria bacterium CG2_30_43_20]PIS06570.1 MAG: hypothetical protein COT79_03840 [Candidatus Berkelbacteria bacterium CG10_big_fil_rev_8_21_14_0_10_43_14]PIU87336.1 MAG: hypothetical protein COS66_01535 [Candidatus Berkelbacteria bacterium CG06_land_8_20_14_3_00_43_10]